MKKVRKKAKRLLRETITAEAVSPEAIMSRLDEFGTAQLQAILGGVEREVQMRRQIGEVDGTNAGHSSSSSSSSNKEITTTRLPASTASSRTIDVSEPTSPTSANDDVIKMRRDDAHDVSVDADDGGDGDGGGDTPAAKATGADQRPPRQQPEATAHSVMGDTVLARRGHHAHTGSNAMDVALSAFSHVPTVSSMAYIDFSGQGSNVFVLQVRACPCVLSNLRLLGPTQHGAGATCGADGGGGGGGYVMVSCDVLRWCVEMVH